MTSSPIPVVFRVLNPRPLSPLPSNLPGPRLLHHTQLLSTIHHNPPGLRIVPMVQADFVTSGRYLFGPGTKDPEALPSSSISISYALIR